MIISLIVAMDRDRGIGYQGRLPWHLSSDLKRFKKLTMGHHLLMGRKTYESIGRTLPGRVMLVVSRNPFLQADGCVLVHSLEEGMRFALDGGEEELFIIGGGEIFSQSLPVADRIYLTIVHTTTKADVFFPGINPNEWVETESILHPAGKGDDFDHTFVTMNRVISPVQS